MTDPPVGPGALARRLPFLAVLATACLSPPRYGGGGADGRGDDRSAQSAGARATGSEAGRTRDRENALVCSDPAPWTADAPPGPCADAAPWTRNGTPAVQIRVDAGAPGRAWSRFYETAVAADHAHTLLCTAWGRNAQSALKKAHAQAGFRYVRFHGILDDDIGVYSEDAAGNPVYDWRRFDEVYDAIGKAGMRPIVEISFMPSALASNARKIQNLLWYHNGSPNISPPADWGRWKALMAAIVLHLEGRYGADEIRENWYFEVWNEPSWMYSLGDAGYTELYASTVAGLLQGDPRVKVGGPAGSSGESPSLIGALLAAANAKKLKLDFITYHRYGDDKEVMADANGMQTFHRSLAGILKDSGFTGELINDEFGPSSKPDVCRDNEVAASFIAKTIHLLGTDDSVAPPSGYGYWALSDLYEEFDTGDALAYREGNYGLLLKGDPRFPESFDVAKPAFNAFRLLHMMGDTRLPTAGGTTEDGVNGAATVSADGNAVQVLLYDHVTGARADSTQSSLVSLTVDNLPFSPGSVRVRHYVVDRNHANSHTAWVDMGKPARPTREQWVRLRDSARLCYYETRAEVQGRSLSLTFPQSVYSVALVEIRR
jgi:xylan 1,4-beta-xylosidase